MSLNFKYRSDVKIALKFKYRNDVIKEPAYVKNEPALTRGGKRAVLKLAPQVKSYGTTR